MANNGAVLSLRGIGKNYGSKIILKEVSLDFAVGSVSLLIGANGAGKSTLLKIMAGLISPSAGKIKRSVDEARIGYLGHATFIYPALTALENLSFWRSLYNMPLNAKETLSCLERVDLKKYAYERAGIFSRGMAQRLNLARLLTLRPDLLLLDEPGTGLDSASSAILRHEISLARDRGACVIWISHDPDKDGLMADRLIALADKKVAYDGSATGWPQHKNDKE